jgi:Immediate early response protein (IER)
MKLMMATEAQKIISISLAKIAASRCVRGGVSLHKNLLVATVLQKARYIFMEEAFHMVHGHYINQANSKFIQQLRYQEHIENQLRQGDKEYNDDDDDSAALNDSELDLFSSPIDSNESLSFLNDLNKGNSNNNNNNNHKYSSSTTSNDLIYLDLDVNSVKSQSEQSSNSIMGHKRRHTNDDEEYDDSDEAILSVFPSKSKQMKFSNNINNNEDESSEEESISSASSCSSRSTTTTTVSSSNSSSNSNSNSSSSSSSSSSSTSENTENCLSLDFLSHDLNLPSSHHISTHTSTSPMAPLDMSNNTSALTSSTSSLTSQTSTTSTSIDRITSLVSIFNFGNLQRTVSTPDLCSSSSNHSTVDNSCCNLQRQIVMTV